MKIYKVNLIRFNFYSFCGQNSIKLLKILFVYIIFKRDKIMYIQQLAEK